MNFDSHGRPNRIYIVDAWSVLASFRVIFCNGRKRNDLARSRNYDRDTRATAKLEFTRRSARLSVLRSALIKSLDPSRRTRAILTAN